MPDSLLAPALRAAGGEFENAWNALLVAELRASRAGADSAAALVALERRVAAAEAPARGTRIAAEALALRARWSPRQRALRVRAAEAESAGTAAQRERRWGDSDSLFRVALAGYQAVGERRRPAWVLGTAGTTWFNAADYGRADSLYRRALAARRALGDSGLVSRAVNTLGSIAYVTGRDEEALRWFREARALRERLGDRAGLATTLNTMGAIAARRGERDSARAWFGQGLAIATARGDSMGVARVVESLAGQMAAAGEVAGARAAWERALRLARAGGDLGMQVRLGNDLGQFLRGQGRFTDAARSFEGAVEAARAAGDPRWEATSLNNLGQAWHNLMDPDRARPPLERAIRLADSLGDASRGARARNNLAIALRLAGDPGAAGRRASQACALAVEAGDSTLVHDAALTLGLIAALDGRDLRGARAWLERAHAADPALGPEREASDLVDLGHVAAQQGRTEDADSLFRRALGISERHALTDPLWLAMLGFGDVAERRGRFVEALAWDRAAAARIDTMRVRQDEAGSVALFSGRLYPYEALIHLLGRLDARSPDSAYAAEAFLWAERARARGLLDLVRATGGPAVAVEPLGLDRARALLASDREALLEYSLGDSSSSLWIVTRRAWKRVALPPRAALRARVETLRRGLSDPASAESPATRAAARALYRTLVEPAEPLLAGVRRLVISPDGPLARIPFEALLAREAPGPGPPPRGAWLVERYDVAYTPSAAALATRSARPGGAIVALGDPAFAPGADAAPDLPRLPETAAELRALGALAGRRPCALLSGAGATRERLLAALAPGGASVLHVATHGRSDEVEPDRSGLWLAWDGSAPGFLSAGEVLERRLGADLVTLSACETALGRLERGEGVLGLARAFLAAGSRSVVVSQWKVNDRSTALLMQRFYRPLLARGAARDRALAEAKRALLRDPATRSPFHWAAFVLVGSAGPLS